MQIARPHGRCNSLDGNQCRIYLSVPFGFGETPRLRGNIGDLFGDLLPKSMSPFSFSGDGEEPPVAEFRRDGVKRTVVSK